MYTTMPTSSDPSKLLSNDPSFYFTEVVLMTLLFIASSAQSLQTDLRMFAGTDNRNPPISAIPTSYQP